MKNLQIGYTFPQEWTNKLHVDRLRVFFSGENLFTLTGIAGMFDPEATAANGWSSGKTYPCPKHSLSVLILPFKPTNV